jgi:hypothetical protein
MSATGVWRTEGFPYAIDNGAWTAHQQSKPFDEGLFVGILERFGGDADWVVAPDVVEGGLASLHKTERWLPKVLQETRTALIAVQDGISPADVTPLLKQDGRLGIFLGGSTEWKVANIPVWGEVAQSVGCYYHIGRVNTKKRIHMCRYARADSYDGTRAIKFPLDIPFLTKATKEFLPCLPI